MSEIERAAVCEHVEFEVKRVAANLDGLTANLIAECTECNRGHGSGSFQPWQLKAMINARGSHNE